MSKILTNTILIFCVLSLSTLFGANPLIVTFSQAKKASIDGAISLNVTNTTNRPIKVLKWNTILEKNISANIFDVKNGKSIVPYMGIMTKRKAPKEDDYTTFEVGETRTININLPHYYEMKKKGSYTVTYKASFVFKANKKHTSKKRLKTQAVQTIINYEPTEKKTTPSLKLRPNFNQCTENEVSVLINAHNAAIVIAKDAYDTLVAAPSSTYGERYTTWFGTADNTRQTTVKNHFNNIYNGLENEQVAFDCDCSAASDPDNTFAYVYPSQPYTIHLCGAFWGAGLTGTDSQAGTLVHETSHFTIVAGTYDYRYGQDDSKYLANYNPSDAIQNADSHEYFAENTPFLTMDEPFVNAYPINNIINDLPLSDSIDTIGDKDLFSFTVNQTGIYTLFTTGDLDSMGRLYASNHELLQFNDDGDRDLNFKLNYTLIKGQTYYLQINAFDDNTGGYTLESQFRKIAKNDFNSDGVSDILWRNGSTNHLWLMNSDGTHDYVDIGTKSSTYRIIGQADFNADGTADILWRKGTSNYLWYMDRDDARSHDYKKITSKTYTLIATKDFNADGIADILWRKDNQNHIWYMHADGSHTYKNIGTKSTAYTIVGTGDLNGDGITDILWRKGHKNYIWYMHIDGSHRYQQIVSKSYNVMAVEDFDADGIADILWRKDNQNHVWYMHEDGTYTYKNIGTKGLTYTLAQTADYNGDGITDIMWRKGSANYLWYMHADGSHTYKKISGKRSAYEVQ